MTCGPGRCAPPGRRIPAAPDDVKARTDAFAEAGCDEFFFFAAAPHADQVDQLKEALG